MLQPKKLLLFFLLIVLSYPALATDFSIKISGNDSVLKGITQDENILFNMINDMRRQNKMTSIPLSPDLCKVARTHIADLIKWRPQDRGCSMHSWSGSGKWTSCCNTKDVFGIQCMKSKPREITGYPGDGYELIYWGEEKATPAEAYELWKQVDASTDMILSRAKWKGYEWKALGVGINDGYAILWLGDTVNQVTKDKYPDYIPEVHQTAAKDTKPTKLPVQAKESVEPKKEVNKKEVPANEVITKQPLKRSGAKYYVVVGSFKTAQAANTELQKVKGEGYPASFILQEESNFRIAVASFDAVEQAVVVKNGLKEKFPGIWVYKK
ncbi:MAG: SPOR domain-containing protein [Lentimicrobiaceae bacterium]|jgi:hypothetical protein